MRIKVANIEVGIVELFISFIRRMKESIKIAKATLFGTIADSHKYIYFRPSRKLCLKLACEAGRILKYGCCIRSTLWWFEFWTTGIG